MGPNTDGPVLTGWDADGGRDCDWDAANAAVSVSGGPPR